MIETRQDNDARARIEPRPGSDFYYAVLYHSAAIRRRLCVHEALRRELSRIPASCSDRGVAYIKLAWWHEELGRLATLGARHELTRELVSLQADDAATINAFKHLAAALEEGVSAAHAATPRALLETFERTYGPLIDRMLDVVGPCAAEERVLLRRLACWLEIAYQQRGLREHRGVGPVCFATQSVTQFGVSDEQLRAGTTVPAVRALLEESLTTTRNEISAALNALPRNVRRRHRLWATLARIQIHALQLTLDDGCHVLERRIELTPVHKLWLAWSSRLRG